MKTDVQQALWIAMTSFVILSAVIKPSEEKCSGRWAIHACWGGNGKRSDPSMELSPSSDILRQLLLRQRPVFPPTVLDSSEDLADSPARPLQSSPAFNIDSSSDEFNLLPPSPPSASRLSALLRTLRTLQRENDGLP